MRHRLVLLALLLVCWVALPAQAATTTLRYGGLRPCYPLGNLPALTLTARVATAGSYRLTHAVTLEGNAPGVPQTVFAGTIAPDAPRTVRLPGGAVAIPGSYRLHAALYRDGGDAPLAQTVARVQVAERCTTPTPAPPPSGTPAVPSTPVPEPTAVAPEDPPDIRWTQALSQVQELAGQAVLVIAVRGHNIGRSAGQSGALLRYDPTALRLLDAQTVRQSDWVRARDDAAGTVTLALGTLGSDARTVLIVRLAVVQPSATVVRLVRDDGQDRSNPLFVVPGETFGAPVPLTAERQGETLLVRGRGYKPGEPLVAWVNTRAGHAVALDVSTVAGDDDDGTITVALPTLPADVVSVVVCGRASDVLGTARIAASSM